MEKLKGKFLKLKNVLKKESSGTKEMLLVYKKLTLGSSVSDQELQSANTQFKEILKNIGFGAIAILPLTIFILPLFIYVAKKFNVDIIPSWLND